MSALERNLGNFFKAEIKASGRKLVVEDKVSITGGSDATIKVYVRASPPIVVHLRSEGIGSPKVTAGCSCPAGKKSRFCKHVWGALLAADEKFPDFLSEKTSIEKSEAEYRKGRYPKQKARMKDEKRERRARESASTRAFPEEVSASLEYFDRNGFPMLAGPDAAVLSEAKRALSRVFHPDKGGSHEETIELNRNCEVLLGFLRGSA